MNRALLILFAFSCFLPACKGPQKLGDSGLNKNQAKIIRKVEESHIPYSYFSAKARVQFSGEEIKQNVTLSLKIIPDSVIYGAVSATLGIEVAKLIIKADQVIILDKFNRKYYTYPFEWIRQQCGIPTLDFQQLCSLLTGQLVFDLHQNNQISMEKGRLVFSQLQGSVLCKTLINTEIAKLSGYLVEDKTINWKAEINYFEDISDGDKSIPKIIEARLYLPEENYLKINYYKIQFNQSVELDLTIPGDYVKAN